MPVPRHGPVNIYDIARDMLHGGPDKRPVLRPGTLSATGLDVGRGPDRVRIRRLGLRAYPMSRRAKPKRRRQVGSDGVQRGMAERRALDGGGCDSDAIPSSGDGHGGGGGGGGGGERRIALVRIRDSPWVSFSPGIEGSGFALGDLLCPRRSGRRGRVVRVKSGRIVWMLWIRHAVHKAARVCRA